MESTTQVFPAVPLVLTYAARLPFGGVWTALSPHAHVALAALLILGAGLQHIDNTGPLNKRDSLCNTLQSSEKVDVNSRHAPPRHATASWQMEAGQVRPNLDMRSHRRGHGRTEATPITLVEKTLQCSAESNITSQCTCTCVRSTYHIQGFARETLGVVCVIEAVPSPLTVFSNDAVLQMRSGAKQRRNALNGTYFHT